MINDHKILFISFFSIFYYCQKIYKDVKKENDGINGNKEISFGSSKKGLFDNCNNGYIDRAW